MALEVEGRFRVDIRSWSWSEYESEGFSSGPLFWAQSDSGGICPMDPHWGTWYIVGVY